MVCADRHHSSTPCADQSSMNHARPKLNGKTLYTLIAFVASRLVIQERIWTYENVIGLSGLIKDYLHEVYWIDVDVSKLELFGWSGTRDREFLQGRHRVKSLPGISPLSRFLLRFHRACTWTFMQFFFAHLHKECEAEMIEDFLWASQRPSSAHKKDGLGELQTYTFGGTITKDRWWRSLN